MIKYLTLFLAILFFTSCKSVKTNTDTIEKTETTIQYKPFEVSTPPSSLKDTVTISKITSAPKGSVIAQKTKGKLSYKLVKKSENEVELDVVHAGVDTVVYVPEVTTIVNKESVKTISEKPSKFKSLVDSTSYFITGVVILLFGLFFWFRR
ncbi:hypothetical protein [Rufibacter sp. LB8]|uniref:hypothetical protein n=1 Tax=Rufibacter sp. LB8 TaxID=2777781 RepID=UPI00178C1A03|nr:hypothetical protein [Rufibacter sp. LB8]